VGTLTVRYWVLQYIEQYFGRPFSQVSVIDVGCGYEPLSTLPNCITFDQPNFHVYNERLGRNHHPTYLGDVRTIATTVRERFDVVYSSHLIEDFVETDHVLRELSTLLKDEKSIMILALPDQKRYEAATRGKPNPHHKISNFGLSYVRTALSGVPLQEVYAHEFWLDQAHLRVSRHGNMDFNFVIVVKRP